MKLLNYTSAYFAGILLLMIAVWAAIFYFALLDEIYDSIDDGLENSKLLIMEKAVMDSSVLNHGDFQEGNYAIREIPYKQALEKKEVYLDTTMYMQNEEDYEPIRMLKTVFRHNNQYYELSIITSMVEEDDLIEDLLFAIVWLYLGLLVTIMLLNNFLLKRIWKPFYQLLQKLEKFRLDQPESVHMQQTPVEEFNILHKTIRKMLQSNVDVYNQQKQFIENASHELQTPLAISMNKLELLMEKNNLTETQMTVLMGVMQSMERLTRLNKSLLLLSKIENRQFQQVEKVSIDQLAKNLWQDFQDQAVFKEVQLQLQVKAPCEQAMHPDLARILLSNLIKNAIVHNRKGGMVVMTISQDQLTISNTGKQEALDEERIFQRFYKDKSVCHSTGLGLAIVKTIISHYGFNIRYAYLHEQHHFMIRF